MSPYDIQKSIKSNICLFGKCEKRQFTQPIIAVTDKSMMYR